MKRGVWMVPWLTIASCGGDSGPPPEPPVGPGLRSVATGREHTCGLWDDNEVRCWGDNSSGQLGLGDYEPRGQSPATMGASLGPVPLGGGTVVQLALGSYHSCVRFKDGGVRCWGDNSYGQLGVPDALDIGGHPGEVEALTAIDLGAKALSISAGGDHTCALLEEGQIKCWGSNEYGQLGQEDNTDRGAVAGDMEALEPIDVGSQAVKQIVTGLDHTCVLTIEGAVKCFGSAYYGNLGTGNTNDRGDEPGEMGAGLATVDLGTKNNLPARISSIAAAEETTCAVLEGGSVKCWGNNESGQLGIGSTEARGARPGEMGNGLPAVDLGGFEVDELALGAQHVCARISTGALLCWGEGFWGQNGRGTGDTYGDEPGEMGDALPRVELGRELGIVTFATRAYHSCAVLDNGGLKCWGDNAAGQLGLGDTDARGDDGGEMGDDLPFVVARGAP